MWGETRKETLIYLWMWHPGISEYLSQLKMTVDIYKRDIYIYTYVYIYINLNISPQIGKEKHKCDMTGSKNTILMH